MIKQLEDVLNSSKVTFSCHRFDAEGEKGVAIQVTVNGKDFCVVGVLESAVPELIRLIKE